MRTFTAITSTSLPKEMPQHSGFSWVCPQSPGSTVRGEMIDGRSDEEFMRFGGAFSVMNNVDLPENTMVLIQTPTEDFQSGCDCSGWCTFESQVSSLVYPGHRRINISKVANSALWDTTVIDGSKEHMPSMPPEDFEQFLTATRLTNGRSDTETLADFYRKTFDSAVHTLRKLFWVSCGMNTRWGSKETERLFKVLPMFRNVRKLNLADHDRLGETDAEVWAPASMRMPKLVGFYVI